MELIWISAALIIGVLAGVLAAVVVMRRRYGDRESVTQLRGEFDAYRSEVTEHFVETAELVNALTRNYKAVYDHLEKGAYDLVGEERLRRRLDTVDEGPVMIEYIGHRRLTPAAAEEAEVRPGGQTADGARDRAAAQGGTANRERAPARERSRAEQRAEARERAEAERAGRERAGAEQERRAAPDSGTSNDAETQGAGAAPRVEPAEGAGEGVRPSEGERAEARAGSPRREAASDEVAPGQRASVLTADDEDARGDADDAQRRG